MAGADPSEELVSREEKPLDIQAPPKTAPRVISTIPISPVTIRSDGSDSVGDAPATPMAASVSPLAPAPVSALGSPERKKIHTVTIRSDGSGRTDTSTAAHNATRARRPSAAAAPPVGNQPMSPNPTGQGSLSYDGRYGNR